MFAIAAACVGGIMGHREAARVLRHVGEDGVAEASAGLRTMEIVAPPEL